MQYDTALYAVFLIFGVTLLTKFIIGAWNWLVIKTQGRVNGIAKIAASVVLVFLAYFYYQAAIKHMNTVNRKMDLGDQASYI